MRLKQRKHLTEGADTGLQITVQTTDWKFPRTHPLNHHAYRWTRFELIFIQSELQTSSFPPHQWTWDGFEEKDSSARHLMLESVTWTSSMCLEERSHIWDGSKDKERHVDLLNSKHSFLSFCDFSPVLHLSTYPITQISYEPSTDLVCSWLNQFYQQWQERKEKLWDFPWM